MTRRLACGSGQPPIEIEAGDLASSLSDGFVEWLDRSIAAGTRFAIGQMTLRFPILKKTPGVPRRAGSASATPI